MARGRTARKETADGAAAAGDLEHLRRDLDAAQAECDAAERAHVDLDADRDAALASEDVAELERHDAATAATERRLAVARARVDRLSGEVEAAEVAAEQTRRLAAYRDAERGLTEARRLIAEEYPAAARALAQIVKRAITLRDAGHRANEALPDGAEALDTILEPGGFNGRHYSDLRGLTETKTVFINRATGLPAGPTDCPEFGVEAHLLWERQERTVERSIPRLPAEPHRAIVDFVNLPGLTDDAYLYPAPFWGRPRSA